MSDCQATIQGVISIAACLRICHSERSRGIYAAGRFAKSLDKLGMTRCYVINVVVYRIATDVPDPGKDAMQL